MEHMNSALNHAQKGFGSTFPNPAVGCVLVRQDTQEVVGAGFHPRAGFPHAEVFALLEATGHLQDGVKAAELVVASHARKHSRNGQMPTTEDTQMLQTIQQFAEQYASPNGPEGLFSNNAFTDYPVTAYVTLEPCCHYGKTPPCAASLVLTKISRVVVGFRDPNPRVDGGGVKLLQDANVEVDMIADYKEEDAEAAKVHRDCSELVKDFVKRITPKSEAEKDYSYVTGSMRRSLRSLAGKKKADGSLTEMEWTGERMDAVVDETTDLECLASSLELDPTWLERVDHLLWEYEIVLLRLNKAIKKKKGSKLLGERIAEQLQAHVAQTVGHTVLLYRPGIPPILDLNNLDGGREDQ